MFNAIHEVTNELANSINSINIDQVKILKLLKEDRGDARRDKKQKTFKGQATKAM